MAHKNYHNIGDDDEKTIPDWFYLQILYVLNTFQIEFQLHVTIVKKILRRFTLFVNE